MKIIRRAISVILLIHCVYSSGFSRIPSTYSENSRSFYSFQNNLLWNVQAISQPTFINLSWRWLWWNRISRNFRAKHSTHIGVIGTGNFGLRILEALKSSSVSRLMFTVIAGENAKSLAKKYRWDRNINIRSRQQNHYSVLTDPSIHAIVIVSPPETHFEYAREALIHGKDVYIEKPFAPTEEEASQLVDLARQNGKILMIGHILLYHPAFALLRERKKELGPIQSIEIHILNHNPPDRLLHGHVIQDLGPHAATLVGGMLGSDARWDTLTLIVSPHRDDVRIKGKMITQEGMVQVDIDLRRDYPEESHERLMRVVGEKKTAVFDWMNNTLTFIDHETKISEVVNFATPSLLQDEMDHFLRCIKDRQIPISDGASSISVVRDTAFWSEDVVPSKNAEPLDDANERSQVISVLPHYFGTEQPLSNVRVWRLKGGKINTTYVAEMPDHSLWVLQRGRKGRDFALLEHNLTLFREAQLRASLPIHWQPLNYRHVFYKQTQDLFYKDSQDYMWRCMNFIPGETYVSLSEVPSEERVSIANAFGEGIAIFHQILSLIPSDQWWTVLPHFHDTHYHIDYLEQILLGREMPLSLSPTSNQKASLKNDFYENYKERIQILLKKLRQRYSLVDPLPDLAEIPSHNDPKIANAIFVRERHSWSLATLVDLDDIQLGMTWDDLADAIRSAIKGALPINLEGVQINIGIMEALIEGYLKAHAVDETEKPALCSTIYREVSRFHIELAARYAADSLVGNFYFKLSPTAPVDHNLFQAEVQIRILEILEGYFCSIGLGYPTCQTAT